MSEQTTKDFHNKLPNAMDLNLDQLLNFQHLALSNNYPCLIDTQSSNWYATNDGNGNTIYKDENNNVLTLDGIHPYSGPVNIIGANLVIMKGATVDNALIIGNSRKGGNPYPTVTIEDGGALTHSVTYNGYLAIHEGGKSISNLYVSTPTNEDGIAGTSQNDIFHEPGNYSNLPGSLYNNGQRYVFTPADGDGYQLAVKPTGKLIQPTLPNLIAADFGNPNFNSTQKKTLNIKGQIGSTSASSLTDYKVLDNDNPCLLGGDWTARWDEDRGETVITNNDNPSESYTGPVNILDGSLTVEENTQIDGINLINTGLSYPKLIIKYGAEVSNSRIYNGFLEVQAGGVSHDNEYFSTSTFNTGINGKSQNDVFYETGKEQGTLALSQLPAGASSSMIVGDGTSALNIGSHGSLENTDFLAINNSNIALTYSQGATVTYPDLKADTPPTSDFQNVNISNNYPCLTDTDSAIWYAINKNGQTLYYDQNGNVLSLDGTYPYHGPVNLVGANLVIEDGATVDELCAIGNTNSGGSTNPTITVMNGGKITNSTLYNGSLYINEGGVSQGNTYFSTATPDGISGISKGDTFCEPGNYGPASGTLYNNGQKHSFCVADGDTINIKVNTTGRLIDPIFPNLVPDNFGDPDFNPNQTRKIVIQGQVGPKSITDLGNYATVENNYECLIGGEWTATYDIVTHQTIITNNYDKTDIHTCPVNILDGNLTVESGATVNGINLIDRGNGYPRLIIKHGGSVTNSRIYNGYLEIQSGGTSENNLYFSTATVETGINGTSINDVFFEPGKGQKGTLNLSGTSSSGTSARENQSMNIGNGEGDVTLGAHGTLTNASFLAGSDSSVTLTYTQGGTINSQATDPCFLPGTMIRTLKGYVKVEHIAVGDKVFVHLSAAGQAIYKPVTRIRKKDMTVHTDKVDDLAGYPVRILKNAIADQVPYKDMLITPEHCLYFEGKLIPVRMLVNGQSIQYDRSFTEYTYYHLELEEHAVIMADGVLSESYLDTDIQNVPVTDGNVLHLGKIQKSWERDAAAPLTVERTIVEPIFNRLAERAKQLRLDLIHDPDLYLVTNHGVRVYPTLKTLPDHYSFVLPNHVQSVQIVSRASRPCDVIGPFVDDRRKLGVLINNVTIFDSYHRQEVDCYLTQETLAGWHGRENASCRWTDGNGFLPLSHTFKEENFILSLKVQAAGPYLIQDESPKDPSLQAMNRKEEDYSVAS